MTIVKLNLINIHFFGILLLLLFPSEKAVANNNPAYAVDLISKELKQGAHTAVRNENYEVDILDYDKIIVTYKIGVTLLNENSNANDLTLYYDSFKKINKIKGRIYDADGELIREIKKREIKDWSAVSGSTMYGDSRVKFVEVSHSNYPYTIEWEYKQTIRNFMYYPVWKIQEFGQSVEKATFTVHTRNKTNLRYKSVNIDLEPIIETQNGITTLKWTVNELQAIKKVSYSPAVDKVLPMILLSPKRFDLGKYKGSMASWKDFGMFMNNLNEGRDVLSKKMTAEVKSLTAIAKTSPEKIDILYRYLQENTRYISVQLGVGGWQTFDANYVEKNKYGDCKALTYFMKAMLNAVDIKAYPVFIRSGISDALITEDFVYPRFNHVILNVPSEDYWLECTSTYSPPNYIGSYNENHKALRVTEQGGELIKTPTFAPSENKEINKATINLSENGDAIISNSCQFIGPREEWYRQVAFEKTKEEQQKLFLKYNAMPSTYINTLKIKPAIDKPETELSYEIEVRKYATKSGKRLFMPINLINPFTSIPTKKERKLAIVVKTGYVFEDEFTFLLPEGYEIESIPEEKVSLESPYGKYSLDLIPEASKIIYKRRLEMLPVDLPAEEYEAFRNFRKKVAELDAAKIVLVKKKT